MNNRFEFNSLILNIVLVLLAFSSSSSLANQASILNNHINILNSEYQQLSLKFYSDKSNYTEDSKIKYKDVDVLLSKLNTMSSQEKTIQLIYFNVDIIKNNIDSKAIFEIIELLLNANEWTLANILYKEIKEDGDASLLATVQFLFAKHYSHRNKWKHVNKLLDNSYSELSEHDAAYAHLLKGTALQHLKKHRDAEKHYQKISEKSPYYNYAQLNISLTSIRQGWWTDAKTSILKQIKNSNKTNKDELINRLHLILGYALLQREYYRDARDAFRHIGLKSNYTNRALLGIALTATSQGDYVGALNALTILKDKKTFDISVDESYLLIPYVYEKLNQEVTVTSSYAEAMKYFQKRIKKLKMISTRHHNFENIKFKLNKKIFFIQNNSFEFDNVFTGSYITNYKNLIRLKQLTRNKKIKKEASKLLNKYDEALQEIIKSLTNKRISHLKSYLNQSRYGLARLYDSSSEQK